MNRQRYLSAIAERFRQLFSSPDPKDRGHEFEILLEALLTTLGIEVVRNPGTARPRQTDLHFRYGGTDFIVEVRWLKRNIHVNDIDGVKSRLDRVPAGFVGCVISMSDYAPDLMREIESRRDREVLLFNALEVYQLFTGSASFTKLLQQKRDEFRIHGRVWFSHQDPTPRPEKAVSFPTPSEWIADSPVHQINHDDFTNVVFARDLPDIGNNLGMSSLGVALRLILTKHCGIPELRQFMGRIQNVFPFSTLGSFSITQSHHSWHGIGAEPCLSQVENWKARYEAAGLRDFHHSEEFAYFDTCMDGFQVLSGQQRVGDTNFFAMLQYEIRLPGVPVNAQPFIDLCREFDHEGASFTQLESSGYDRILFRPPLVVSAVKEIHQKVNEDTMVCGLVIKNPFFGNHEKIPKTKLEYSPFALLHKMEHIVVSLTHWHEAGDIINRYGITQLQGYWTTDVPVFHGYCTWDGFVKKATPYRTTPPTRKELKEFMRSVNAKDPILEELKKRAKRQRPRK